MEPNLCTYIVSLVVTVLLKLTQLWGRDQNGSSHYDGYGPSRLNSPCWSLIEVMFEFSHFYQDQFWGCD